MTTDETTPGWWQRRFWTLPFWMRGWELVAFILAAYVFGILLGATL